MSLKRNRKKLTIVASALLILPRGSWKALVPNAVAFAH
jgi:hypothetical protein